MKGCGRATCLALLLCSALVWGYEIIGDEEPSGFELEWPEEYYLKGETIDLYRGSNEPFEQWYSASRNRSRQDFNHGIDKVFYLGDEEKKVKVFPVTTEEVSNQIQCRESAFGSDPVQFLPSTLEYEYKGKETLEGEAVSVWTNLRNDELHKHEERTLYVRKDGSPSRFEEKKWNSATGQVDSHVITNYYGFNDTLSDEDFAIDTTDCEADKDDDDDDDSGSLERLLQALHPSLPGELDEAFAAYTRHHGREYGAADHQIRKLIFEQNWRKVRDHNRANYGYKLVMNEFADRTPEELRLYTGLLPKSNRADGEDQTPPTLTLSELLDSEQELPDWYDLRFEGYITPVKNQGNCGSCWAFTTTAAVEGAYAKQLGGRLVDLSEQSLVDCAWGFKNSGCGGGELENALKYIEKHGIPRESDYGEYIQNNGFCSIANVSDPVRIKGFYAVSPRNPEALKAALRRYGPVAVSLSVLSNMYLYRHGVYYDVQCEPDTSANHGMVVVGYGTRDGADYWIMKNSWGERWGQDGYILMSAASNNCGILDTPYAIIM